MLVKWCTGMSDALLHFRSYPILPFYLVIAPCRKRYRLSPLLRMLISARIQSCK
jgi:hypothetical protein